MMIERLAAACIFPSFPGLEAPAWILRRLEEGIGGICLFAYNVHDPEQLATLTATLRRANPEVIVGIDEEGGDVTRLEAARGSSFPGNGALGAVDDVELTEQVASAMGSELAAVGVNLDFAPVADVLVNPANPVIGIRSFGADADLVARHVAAFVRGLQRQGIAACAKHFPGHGSTEQDSHLELPVVTDDIREGLPPFRAAIEAGVQTIMTAHVLVPALDDVPATVSPAILQGLLRKELGYDGLVIADALEMKGLSDTVGVEQGAVLALRAGVDAVLVGHDLGEGSVAAIQAALVDGVPEERLCEAAGRAGRVAAWSSSISANGPAKDAARDVARRALETVGEPRLDEAPLVVELRPNANMAAGEAEHSLGEVLAGRLPGTRTLVLDEQGTPPAGGADVVVVRDAHRHAWMRELTEQLSPSVVVEIGVPVWRPDGPAYIATHGGSRVSFEAVAEVVA
jgi:beta-N-acetylhexosaminidase